MPVRKPSSLHSLPNDLVHSRSNKMGQASYALLCVPTSEHILVRGKLSSFIWHHPVDRSMCILRDKLSRRDR
jgi:hypothetical protein